MKPISATPHSLKFLALWLASWLASGILLYATGSSVFLGLVIQTNQQTTLGPRRLVAFIFAAALFGGVWLYSLVAILASRPPRRLLQLWSGWMNAVPRVLRMLIAGILVVAPAVILLYTPIGLEKWGYAFRLFLAALVGLLAGPVLFPAQNLRRGIVCWAATTMMTGVCFTAGASLTQVTDYPFSLGWSEGTRFWDYSMMFGAGRYTLAQPSAAPFISPGRQFIWGVAFLLPKLTLQGMRLWDSLLWIWPALVLGWTAAAGKAGGSRKAMVTFLFGAWTYLLIAQGPIYAPLVICAVLVAIAVRVRWLPVSLLLVLAAGYYAVNSRWTWVYAPGLWAGMLALLEIEKPMLKPQGWKALLRPVVLGISGYIGGQILPAVIKWVTTHPARPVKLSAIVDLSNGVTNQPLLWERLLPNPTYSPGILLGILWVGLPIILLLAYLIATHRWRINALQSLAVLGVSLATLGVGIIASTKIGGGSNLHNLDMFWLTLALAAAWALRAWKTAPYSPEQGSPWLTALLVLTLITPLSYQMQFGAPLILPPQESVQEAMRSIQAEVKKAGADVLFIDQRQLLTFGYVENVPLISAYEKKFMMDQAMGSNQKYFDTFYKDLAAQRFKLIVVEPLTNSVQSDEFSFGNENDAWVKWVSMPLRCYYESEYININLNVGVYRPRESVDLTQPGCPQLAP